VTHAVYLTRTRRVCFFDAKVVSTTDMVGTVQISTLKMDQELLMVMTTYTTCA
jgi:hypothetical protein